MLSFSSPFANGSLAVSRPRMPHPRRLAGLIHTPSEVLPHLWLSGLYTAVDEEQLVALGVTHIVSVLEQKPLYPRSLPKLKTLHVPLPDVDDADILHHLNKTTDFIRRALEDKRNTVLVHCAMGISRSATVVCAYLIATHALAPAHALDFLISKREIVCPNLGFRRQLDIFAAHLHGESRTRKLRKPMHTPPPPVSMPASVRVRSPSHSHSHPVPYVDYPQAAHMDRSRSLWPSRETQAQTRPHPPPISRRGSSS